MNDSRATELLRRLVEWQYKPAGRGLEQLMYDLEPICADAKQYLASVNEQEQVYAESNVEFVRDGDEWYFIANGEGPGPRVRIPVPAHLVNPPVLEGRVIEDPK